MFSMLGAIVRFKCSHSMPLLGKIPQITPPEGRISVLFKIYRRKSLFDKISPTFEMVWSEPAPTTDIPIFQLSMLTAMVDLTPNQFLARLIGITE